MRKHRTRTSTHTRVRAAAAALGTAALGGAGLLAPGTAAAVTGGTAVPAGSLSFLAEVTHVSGGLCSGTLVAPQWVLTASHCAEGAPANEYSVRVGNTTRGTGGQTRSVTEVHNHPDYKGGHNDVALLKLDTPITTIAPVALAKPSQAHLWDGAQAGPFTKYDQGTTVGWGTDSAGAFPANLQQRVVDITPAVTDGAGIRTIPVSGGPCPGDSGGPLLVTVDGQLVQAGVLKAANCSTSGSYSEVGAGGNRQFLVGVLPALGDNQGSWQARHDLTAAQYQAEFDRLVAQGYRLVDVSGYEEGGQARYAAIWDTSGGAWQARHGLTSAQYQAEFDRLAAQGFRPVRVSAYSVGGQARFAAIWDRSGGAWEARHGLTSEQYQAEFDTLTARGYRLLDVSGYTDGGQVRYAAIWDTGGPGTWQARHGLTSAQYQAAFDDALARGFRLARVAGYGVGGEARFAALWTA